MAIHSKHARRKVGFVICVALGTGISACAEDDSVVSESEDEPANELGASTQAMSGCAPPSQWTKSTDPDGVIHRQYDGSQCENHNCGLASAAMLRWVNTCGSENYTGGQMRIFYRDEFNLTGCDAVSTSTNNGSAPALVADLFSVIHDYDNGPNYSSQTKDHTGGISVSNLKTLLTHGNSEAGYSAIVNGGWSLKDSNGNTIDHCDYKAPCGYNLGHSIFVLKYNPGPSGSPGTFTVYDPDSNGNKATAICQTMNAQEWPESSLINWARCYNGTHHISAVLARGVDAGVPELVVGAKGTLITDATPDPLTCASVMNASTTNGASIVPWPCHHGTNQFWTLTVNRQLVSQHSGKCARIRPLYSDGIVRAGDPVEQYTCSSTANKQKWLFPSMQVVNGSSLYCIEHTSAEGGSLTIQPCSETDSNQRFIYRADARELKSTNGWCVEAQNGGASETAVKLAECSPNNDSLSQKWIPDRGGFVSGVNTAQCLRVKGGAVDVPGSLIETYPCNDNEKQRWGLRGAIEDSTSVYCLEAPMTAGAQMRVKNCNGSPQQTWTLWSPG